jgi:3-oxoacyl-[acyl-carrier-protein] synthase II
LHKGISFESALLDGTMLLKEKEAENVLVGGIDEMTDTSFTVLSRLGLYKRWPVSNLSLFNTPSKGTIGGEGAAFFLLTGTASADNMAGLTGLQTFYKPVNSVEIEEKIKTFLARHKLKIGDIDLIITGKNGDLKNDAVYNQFNETLFADIPSAGYKHLSGEYPTSSSFALWLAANIIKKEEIPAIVLEDHKVTNAPKKILIYNHYLNVYHSLMLISAC